MPATRCWCGWRVAALARRLGATMAEWRWLSGADGDGRVPCLLAAARDGVHAAGRLCLSEVDRVKSIR